MSLEIKYLAKRIAEEQAEIDKIEEGLDKMKAVLNEDKLKMIELMNQNGITSFRSEFGNIIKNRRFSVSLPKDPDDWTKLWNWLEEKGHKEALMTINSQRFNSFYAAEMDNAKAEGNFDFQIPGIGEPKASEYLSIRK